MSDLIILNERDNVGVLKSPRGEVPAGHKIALVDITKGAPVVKYGYPIGVATEDIREGDLMPRRHVAARRLQHPDVILFV